MEVGTELSAGKGLWNHGSECIVASKVPYLRTASRRVKGLCNVRGCHNLAILYLKAHIACAFTRMVLASLHTQNE